MREIDPLGLKDGCGTTIISGFFPNGGRRKRRTGVEGLKVSKSQSRPSDLQTFRPSDLQTFRPSDLQTFRPSDFMTPNLQSQPPA
jgi:hypothetical protein